MMGDYTPTTEEIKSSATEFNAKHEPEQFDRWLAEHDREVIRDFVNAEVEYVRQGFVEEKGVVMGEHSEHCDDVACLGCECDPECDPECDDYDGSGVNRDYYAGMLQGRLEERERIVELLKTVRVGDEWVGRDYVIDLISGEETE